MATDLRPGVLMTDTEYGIALLDEDNGAYFTLNPTAAVVVRALAGGGGPAAATAALVAEYGVDPATAEADVEELLGTLHEAGLVR
jgi:PqqD family protein of HPr-rel-A system